MSKLVFQGVVALGDEYRVASEGEKDGAILIGDRDVINEVDDVKWDGPVTVAFADQHFTGDLAIEMGWGYTEWTPMDPDKLCVGPHNIIELLTEHDGKEVTLWIADEPVNVLEAVPG